jgi:hypothetical protein
MTGSTRFTEGEVSHLCITNPTNGGVTFFSDHPHFFRWQFKRYVISVLGNDLGKTTGRAYHLTTFTGYEFNIVNFST